MFTKKEGRWAIVETLNLFTLQFPYLEHYLTVSHVIKYKDEICLASLTKQNKTKQEGRDRLKT